MALNYVSLTLDLYDGAGNVISGGTATFTPSVTLTDTVDHEWIPPAPVTVSFKVTGPPVVKLLATDNAAPLPAGWAWSVSFSGVPGNPAGFSFDLPFASGAAQYLSSVTQVANPVTTFPLNPMTALGDVIYGGASGTPERLGIGSEGQALAVGSSGVPAWTTPPASRNVKVYGAKGDGQVVVDAAMTSGSAVLTSSSALFAPADVGKLVMVDQAGAGGEPLGATITAYTSATSVTLSVPAAATVSGVTCYWGTDDSAAIQATMNAAQYTRALTAGVDTSNDAHYIAPSTEPVWVPYGIYMTSTALLPRQQQSFAIYGEGATICAPSSALFDFQGPGHLLEGGVIEIAGLWLEGAGGHIIQNVNIHGRFDLHDCHMTQRSPSHSLFYNDDVVRNDGNYTALYQATFRHITYYLGAGTRSIEAWHIVSNTGADLTDITWEQVNGPNPPGYTGNDATADTTQYQYYITCSGSSSNATAANLTWRNILASDFFGGLVKVGAGRQITIENVDVINTYAQPITNDLFAFIADPVSGAVCEYVTIRNVHRFNNLGSQANHAPPYDVSFAVGCSYIRIDNYTGPYYGGQGPFINLNGAANAVLISNGGTAGTLAVANPGADTVQIQGGDITIGGVSIVSATGGAQNQLLAENFDVAAAGGSAAAVSGTIYLMAITIARPLTVKTIRWSHTAAGSGAVAGENWAALVDSAGAILASVGIDSAVTNGGNPSATIASTVLAPGLYYVVLLFNATTPPTVARSSAALTQFFVGTSGATLRAAVNGTAATALPASFTLANNSSTGAAPFWVGLA